MTHDDVERYELRIERPLRASRAALWRCWTVPELLERWFAPPSWTTEVKALELYPGGASHIVMRGPSGEESAGAGVFLEVSPEQRLVFTNAFRRGWIPATAPAVVPFMVTIIEMDEEGDHARYAVRALHWTEEARRGHARAGFHEGWAQTAGQLEAVARALG